MAKVLATIKGVITRLVFALHGLIAIWQVTEHKKDIQFWYLSTPILLLLLEGIFTLTIKENQEWKWFCPSVFIYLGSVVPAIWLLELDKVARRLRGARANVTVGLRDLSALVNDTAAGNTTEITLLGKKVANINLNTDTMVTLIEQFLMLTLIVGRWLLPKGDLTRDQLSQLLLVYIGTAADIIEFFDSFKEDTVMSEHLLVMLTLGIWSWSLMQFTVVLTATKSRKSRGTAHHGKSDRGSASACCCSIEVCAIMMNIALQDAPFLVFRLLIIIHYKIVSYMNIFFTCKNTLVIMLQVYRLYVLHSELSDSPRPVPKHRKDKHHHKHHKKAKDDKKSRREQHSRKPRRQESSVAVISEARKEDRVEGGRIRAIILTSGGGGGEEFRELELGRLLREQLADRPEGKAKSSKKKAHKSQTSEESLNNIQQTTDDSGI